MASGSWPDSVAMAPPIINSVMVYEDCPSVEDLKCAVTAIMAYDRFGGIPTLVRNCWVLEPRSRPPKDADINRLITVIDVSSQGTTFAKTCYALQVIIFMNQSRSH